jgi:hypothetical protein
MMFDRKMQTVFLMACLCLTIVGRGGPYTEAGVNGYIGDDWRHANPLPPEEGGDPNAIVNPIFRGWATGVKSYEPSPGVAIQWRDTSTALGPATGDKIDIVSLGDVNTVDSSDPPGQIILSFGDPEDPNDPNHIRDVDGYDFVVFENGFLVTEGNNPGHGYRQGEVFAEFGYVEVSSDGNDFARFPPVSLTPDFVGDYGSINISSICNLAGKHINADGICTGTPFDLRELLNEPNVISGTVDINNIIYVRIVDIPGSGYFKDEAGEHIDPNTWPDWADYDANHPIYDAWLTYGSGGLDLEAIGVLEEQQYSADINLDGIVDFFDFALFASAWQSHFGEDSWVGRCDLAKSQNLVIDFLDFVVFANQWRKVESWRGQ